MESSTSGQVTIDVEQSIRDVNILMGDPQSFEHYSLNSARSLLKFKRCYKTNKIALIEKENYRDYIVMQYFVENDWNLVVTKCVDQEARKTWDVKQELASGQLRDLGGVRKIYYEKYCKNPKMYND